MSLNKIAKLWPILQCTWFTPSKFVLKYCEADFRGAYGYTLNTPLSSAPGGVSSPIPLCGPVTYSFCIPPGGRRISTLETLVHNEFVRNLVESYSSVFLQEDTEYLLWKQSCAQRIRLKLGRVVLHNILLMSSFSCGHFEGDHIITGSLDKSWSLLKLCYSNSSHCYNFDSALVSFRLTSYWSTS